MLKTRQLLGQKRMTTPAEQDEKTLNFKIYVHLKIQQKKKVLMKTKSGQKQKEKYHKNEKTKNGNKIQSKIFPIYVT